MANDLIRFMCHNVRNRTLAAKYKWSKKQNYVSEWTSQGLCSHAPGKEHHGNAGALPPPIHSNSPKTCNSIGAQFDFESDQPPHHPWTANKNVQTGNAKCLVYLESASEEIHFTNKLFLTINSL